MSRLKIRRHDKDYAELELIPGKTYLLGRKEDSDVVLQPDPGISRTHVKIYENENREWIVQVLSEHIPITFEGKSLSSLLCKSSKTMFYVSPYHFEFTTDEKLEERRQEEDNVSESFLNQPHQEDHAAAHSQNPQNSLSNHSGQEPIDPEVSFHGNEEVTNDVFQGDEPYLKFMYTTHSESIRLKGNKWIAGRDNIAQIHLDDKKASRQHFSIEKVGLEYFIKDLGSANGTLLNGQELTPQEVKDIKSGDIITVNQLTIIFELRDLAFSEKLKDLPLQVYTGPMILTSQEWDMVAPAATLPTQALAQLPGTAQKIDTPKNHMRLVLIAVAAVVIIGGALYNSGERQPASQSEQIKSFENLKPEDKKIIIDAYNAAQSSIDSGHIEIALSRLAVIHKILPFYKDSLELQTRLIEKKEILRQQAFIAQQKMDQEKLRLKVTGIVNDCRERYQFSVDIAATKACLNEAQQLDPENSDAQSLVAEVEMRLAQAEEAERRQKEFDANVEKGRDLFYKAKNLFQNHEYQDAITAFSNHLNANLPDPDNLRDKSGRAVASIEKMINNEKSKYMTDARHFLDAGNHREALNKAMLARRVDPNDYDIANFIEETNRDLEQQMQRIFMDATLEEKLGNAEISKTKWKEIIKRDLPTGVYYQKAKRKLRENGL